jgi:menaquinone-dependent protoporphyrinogen IX oxidase
MTTLVVYASKYGATQGIAERIADKLVLSGHPAQARPEPPRESWRLVHARRSKQWPSRAGIPRS